jgi:uncharacterized protein YjgD (DUF1641 family)
MSSLELANNETTVLLKAIYSKLEKIEDRLAFVEVAVKEGNNVIATSVDTFDSIMNSENNAKVEKVQEIVSKLTTNETLDRALLLIDKFEKIAPLLEEKNLVNTIKFFADSVDDIFARFKDKGIDITVLVDGLGKILPVITDAKTFDLLNLILSKTDLAIQLLENLETLPNMLNMFVDTFDEIMAKVNSNDKLQQLKTDLLTMADLDKSQKILHDIKANFSEVNNKTGTIGFLDILKHLNDPEVKKQLFFSLLAIKSISKNLSK